ncbi:hypothetical protein PPACK8108_LOCUS25015 [Phakopsora pachyrhizi]|uniref:Uncharacterized protein n=1 Tax=Phakopsora pachyrhizi TaxID=170000 RepID=A0AAV0BSR3_PHAPC|nr:hypothetical protein PPACK8108_LOCUS25015 [Phakopsora pachyrhizi]
MRLELFQSGTMKDISPFIKNFSTFRNFQLMICFLIIFDYVISTSSHSEILTTFGSSSIEDFKMGQAENYEPTLVPKTIQVSDLRSEFLNLSTNSKLHHSSESEFNAFKPNSKFASSNKKVEQKPLAWHKGNMYYDIKLKRNSLSNGSNIKGHLLQDGHLFADLNNNSSEEENSIVDLDKSFNNVRMLKNSHKNKQYWDLPPKKRARYDYYKPAFSFDLNELPIDSVPYPNIPKHLQLDGNKHESADYEKSWTAYIDQLNSPKTSEAIDSQQAPIDTTKNTDESITFGLQKKKSKVAESQGNISSQKNKMNLEGSSNLTPEKSIKIVLDEEKLSSLEGGSINMKFRQKSQLDRLCSNSKSMNKKKCKKLLKNLSEPGRSYKLLYPDYKYDLEKNPLLEYDESSYKILANDDIIAKQFTLKNRKVSKKAIPEDTRTRIQNLKDFFFKELGLQNVINLKSLDNFIETLFNKTKMSFYSEYVIRDLIDWNVDKDFEKRADGLFREQIQGLPGSPIHRWSYQLPFINHFETIHTGPLVSLISHGDLSV